MFFRQYPENVVNQARDTLKLKYQKNITPSELKKWDSDELKPPNDRDFGIERERNFEIENSSKTEVGRFV